MSDFKKPSNEQEFNENFAQIKPSMNETEAYYESSRCLFCYDAPCVNACPTGIDIPLFIRQINTGDTTNAAKTIYDSNWSGYACGKVCPTEVLCEGACVYNGQNVKPIEIGRLQAYATGTVISSGKAIYKVGESNGRRIAVIGAGPAGLAAACELRLKGYDVDVFEAKDQPSGLTVHGVAPYKITNEEVLNEVEYLVKQFGFRINYNSAVVNRAGAEKLESEYDAIFLGIGLGRTNMLPIPGVDKEGVVGATEFVEELRAGHHDVKVDGTVVVIGGGNTAMDAASECSRMGADNVFLVYRGEMDKMSAYEFEYELARSVGAQGVFNSSPVEILGDGKVSAVKFKRTDGEEFNMPCEMVVMATGQLKQKELLADVFGVEYDERGCVKVNDRFQCSNEKYFAAGDMMNGGAEVVNAAAEGKAAAKCIDEFLSSDRA